MIARRILFLTMIVGTSLMACTAVVLGTIGDYKDAQLGDPNAPSGEGGTSSSGNSSSGASSSGADDPCSLLKPYPYSEPFPSNECAECIKRECASDVAFACDAGGKKAAWFSDLGSCAQNPYLSYPAPESAGGTWGCDTYDKPDAAPISGGGDQAKERAALICVRDNCVTGNGAHCRLCDVSIKATGKDQTQHLLSADKCGKLFTEHCNQTIVDCCRSSAISEIVEFCANTDDGENLAKCRSILEANGDAQAFKDMHPGGWDPDDFDCARKLADCFDTHKGDYQCE